MLDAKLQSISPWSSTTLCDAGLGIWNHSLLCHLWFYPREMLERDHNAKGMLCSSTDSCSCHIILAHGPQSQPSLRTGHPYPPFITKHTWAALWPATEVTDRRQTSDLTAPAWQRHLVQGPGPALQCPLAPKHLHLMTPISCLGCPQALHVVISATFTFLTLCDLLNQILIVNVRAEETASINTWVWSQIPCQSNTKIPSRKHRLIIPALERCAARWIPAEFWPASLVGKCPASERLYFKNKFEHQLTCQYGQRKCCQRLLRQGESVSSRVSSQS